MGKSRDLSEFERGKIVGARRAGCSISETVSRLGFSKTAVSRVYREWREKQKTRSHRGPCGRKRLVDDSGERRMERVVEANHRATTEQIQALYNSGGGGRDRPISLTTTRRTLRRLGYSRGAPQRRARRPDALAADAPPPPVKGEAAPRVESSADSESSSDGDARGDAAVKSWVCPQHTADC